jgi:tetratricopeptide (TPR) repeat protein
MCYISLVSRPPAYGEEGTLLARRPILPTNDAELPCTDGECLPSAAVRKHNGRYGDITPVSSAGNQNDSGLPAFGAHGLSARAEELLIAISVYREPADRNAVLFQIGTHDWTAARVPDRQGPAPPYQAPPDLAELLDHCVATDLLSVSGPGAANAGPPDAWFVDRWIAGYLHAQLAAKGRAGELADAHRRGAAYWQWRAAAWPQERRADIHDLLEARQHLFSSGDIAGAGDVTRVVCAQLRAWGDLGQEADLVQSTLEWLPGRSTARADWLHELGTIASLRGDHPEAERRYAESSAMFAALHDYPGVAKALHSLGVQAQAQGEYRRAERYYRRSASAQRRADARPASAAPAAPSDSADDQADVAGSGAREGGQRAAASATAEPGRPDRAGPPDESARVRLSLAAGLDQQQVRRSAPSAGPRPRGRLTRWPVPWVAITVLGILALAITSISTLTAGGHNPGTRPAGSADSLAARYRAEAASWVASQVGRASVIACDPAMCAMLQQRAVPAGDLLALGPSGPPDPLASNIVVATAPVRAEFGTRLATVYAPLIIASFGTGPAAVEVRAIAPDGAAAYRAEIATDLHARERVGAELARNARLVIPAGARAQLSRGEVDTRLLAVLATLADLHELRIVTFGDAGPRASAIVPMRSVVITQDVPGPAAASWCSSVLSFLAAQQPPYRPASASLIRLARGQSAVRIEYPTPGPLGLLTTSGLAPELHAQL